PWPTFISSKTRTEFAKAAVSVFDLLRIIPKRFFNNDPQKISRYYNITPETANYFLKGLHNQRLLKNLIGRADFILNPQGLKCLEYNIAASLGGFEIDSLKYTYRHVPVIQTFLQKNNINLQFLNVVDLLCEHIANCVLEVSPGNSTEINTVYAFPDYVLPDSPSFMELAFNDQYRRTLRTKFNNREGKLAFCDYQHLHVKGDYVYFKDMKVDCLFEQYLGFIPTEILKVWEKDNIVILDGPATRLLSNKLNIALLSENEDSELFSSRERENIKKYIPWTRRIRPVETTYNNEKIQLTDFILANREKLILKPIEGAAGWNVIIGRYTSESKWQELVKGSLESDGLEKLPFNDNPDNYKWKDFLQNVMKIKTFIVQEYVDSSPYLYQDGADGFSESLVVWGFFVFGSRYAGEWVRVLSGKDEKGIVNRAQGAEEGVVFEVD
ncbi:MAG: hypothetical protein GY940_31575, partial [bacterium]|nr:hypothetical protein [bacterium]